MTCRLGRACVVDACRVVAEQTRSLAHTLYLYKVPHPLPTETYTLHPTPRLGILYRRQRLDTRPTRRLIILPENLVEFQVSQLCIYEDYLDQRE